MESKPIKAVILVGGLGTRLKNIAYDIPKPMIPIMGIPFLEYTISLLKKNGITDIVLCVSYMANKIKSYFGDGRRLGVNLVYSEEEIPLGTAGAVKKAEKYIEGDFLLIYGDVQADIDFNDFINFHNKKNTLVTIAVKRTTEEENNNPIKVNVEKDLIDFLEEYPKSEKLLNTNIYLIKKEALNFLASGKNLSIESDFLPIISQKSNISAYEHKGFFVDLDNSDSYEKFKEKVLSNLLIKEEEPISEAMHKISNNKIDILLVTDSNNKLIGVVNDRIIKENIMRGINISEQLKNIMVKNPTTANINDSPSKKEDLLMAGIRYLPIINEEGKVKAIEVRSEKIKTESYPVLRGKAPLRISFAGGGTDFNYFFEKHGGAVISSTIDKYCYATLIKRADRKVIIDSDTTKEIDIYLDSLENIKYDGKFDLIKAVIKIINPDFGFELYLHNDLPPGRGLGSSATISVLLVKMFSNLMNLSYDDYKIAEIAYSAERDELQIKGGWQDQYCTVTGGFNFIEFGPDKKIIYPLRLKEELIKELNNHLMLCYIGRAHMSGEVHNRTTSSFRENEEIKVENLKKLKNVAIEIKEALLTEHLEDIGRLLRDSWEYKKNISSYISNSGIDYLYELGLKNGAYGGKLLGAGSGGYILFFYSPSKRNILRKALESKGGEILNFNFESKGVEVWSGKNRF